jgi:hypothetical protein
MIRPFSYDGCRVEIVGLEDETSPTYVDFLPGNGFSYKFIVTPLTSNIGKRIGAGDGTALVAYYNGANWTAYPLGYGNICHASYVREKFGEVGQHANAIAAAINGFLSSYDVEYGRECAEAVQRMHSDRGDEYDDTVASD